MDRKSNGNVIYVDFAAEAFARNYLTGQFSFLPISSLRPPKHYFKQTIRKMIMGMPKEKSASVILFRKSSRKRVNR